MYTDKSLLLIRSNQDSTNASNTQSPTIKHTFVITVLSSIRLIAIKNTIISSLLFSAIIRLFGAWTEKSKQHLCHTFIWKMGHWNGETTHGTGATKTTIGYTLSQPKKLISSFDCKSGYYAMGVTWSCWNQLPSIFFGHRMPNGPHVQYSTILNKLNWPVVSDVWVRLDRVRFCGMLSLSLCQCDNALIPFYMVFNFLST